MLDEHEQNIPQPETAEDPFEKLQELYRRLDDSLLGRSVGILVDTEEQAYPQEQQEKMGVTIPDNRKRKFVKLFHALPVNMEGSQHVLLTPEGRILYVNKSTSVGSDDYDQAFSEFGTLSELQLKHLSEAGREHNLANFLRDDFTFFGIRNVYDSYNPQHYDLIVQSFDQAIETAQKRLELIEQNKQKSIKHQIQGLERLFGTSSGSTPHEGETE